MGCLCRFLAVAVVLLVAHPAIAERSVAPTDLQRGGTLEVSGALGAVDANGSVSSGGKSVDLNATMIGVIPSLALWVVSGAAVHVSQPFVVSSSGEVDGKAAHVEPETGRADFSMGVTVGGNVSRSVKLVADLMLTPDSGAEDVGNGRTDVEGMLYAATPAARSAELFFGLGYGLTGEDDDGKNSGDWLKSAAGLNFRTDRLSLVPRVEFIYQLEASGDSKEAGFVGVVTGAGVGFEVVKNLTFVAGGTYAHMSKHEASPGVDLSATAYGADIGVQYLAGGLF